MNSNLEREILDRLIRLETKLDNQDFQEVSKKIDKALNKTINNEQDIKEIKDTNKWLWRTVIGAILLNALGILFKI